ncbi:MAG: helix-turn-helix transcriptional regulator [Verrucomicrobia bacterium]|nr:helix-turn-helix transcriptional regulator [Verrucomicrobiota bacterium]
MKQPRIIGTALEMLGGQARPHACYGTYVGDIPDPNFRFNIRFVEHIRSFPVHRHEYSELTVVLGGRGIHLADAESYALEEGDVFIIDGSIGHGFQDPVGLKLCDIMFDPRQFLASCRELSKTVGFHALFGLPPPFGRPGSFRKKLHLVPEELAYVTSLLSTLKDEFSRRAEGWQTMIKSTFHILATYLARLYAHKQKAAGLRLIRMLNVVSYIQNHYREPLCVEELARLAHWSPSQFERNFKRLYNTTPVRFINQLRLREACELLKDPNRDITTIAFDLGFCSSSFFGVQFKRFMGQSPSQYRRTKLAGFETPMPLPTFAAGARLNSDATTPRGRAVNRALPQPFRKTARPPAPSGDPLAWMAPKPVPPEQEQAPDWGLR